MDTITGISALRRDFCVLGAIISDFDLLFDFYFDSGEIVIGDESDQNQNINRANCLADECLAVNGLDYPAGNLSDQTKEALTEAINDEYKAHALYEKTIAKLGFL